MLALPLDLGIPQRDVATFFGALRQLDQLRWRQRVGKAKHSLLTEIHSYLPEKTIVDRRAPALLAVASGRVAATSVFQRDLIVTLMVLQPSHVSARQQNAI